MKTAMFTSATIVAVGVLAIFGYTLHSDAKTQPYLSGWSKEHKEAVYKMTKKYGKPHEVTPNMVIWYNNGPWKKTVITREEVEHHFPKSHKDFIQQYINYRLPVSSHNDIANFNGSVVVDKTKGEISARCNSEAMNILLLNMANEVLAGVKVVDLAREVYTQKASEYAKGIKSPYTEGLLFNISDTHTADLDDEMFTEEEQKRLEASNTDAVL